LDPCVYDVFDSQLALELNPEVMTLTPGTPCICVTLKDRKRSLGGKNDHNALWP